MWEFDEFCDSTITTTIKSSYKDKGQVITSYALYKTYDVDMQPIEEATKVKTWGKDIEATWQMYTNIDLEEEDVIVYNNKSYSIEKKIDWISYKIYAIKEVDIKVNG